MLLILGLMYVRLRENDEYTASLTDAGYVDAASYAAEASGVNASVIARDGTDYVIFAEGFEQIYLYSGTYEVSICAKGSDAEVAFYQVVDVSTNTILAEHDYTPGEEYHVVRFTTDVNCERVVIRSYISEADADSGNAVTIYGCTITSDGAVCNDAGWITGLVLILAVLTGLGIHRWIERGKGAVMSLTALTVLASLPFMSEKLPYLHDMWFHIARIFSLGQAFTAGEVPQRLLQMGGASIIPLMYPEILLYGAG